jgi:hypothetical protein
VVKQVHDEPKVRILVINFKSWEIPSHWGYQPYLQLGNLGQEPSNWPVLQPSKSLRQNSKGKGVTINYIDDVMGLTVCMRKL